MKPNPEASGTDRRLIASPLFRVVVIIGVIGMGVCSARAQESGDQPKPPANKLGDVEVLLTPYLWMPWTDISIKPSNPRVPSSSGTVDVDQLFNHLSWVPFMGEAEVRDGPYGIVADYIHAPLRAGITTRNILFSGGTGGMVLDTGTAMFLYRPVAQPDQYLDVGIGVRAWGIEGTIALNQGLLPAFSVTRGASWADPLFGVRYHHELGDGFGVTAYGDFGGFGLGAHTDWQLLGTVDYTFKSWLDLHVGFRSLNFNYSLERAGATMNMYGPIVAATFRL